MPIGGGDVGGVLGGFAKLDESGPARVEAQGGGGETIGRDRGQTGHALSARGKHVAELAGHGDHVVIGGAQLRAKRVERGFQAVEPQPKRRRRLNHRFDAPVLHARRFQMRSPDIPTDDDAHRSSQLSEATLDPTKLEGQASRRRQPVSSTPKVAAMKRVLAEVVKGVAARACHAEGPRLWPRRPSGCQMRLGARQERYQDLRVRQRES